MYYKGMTITHEKPHDYELLIYGISAGRQGYMDSFQQTGNSKGLNTSLKEKVADGAGWLLQVFLIEDRKEARLAFLGNHVPVFEVH